MITILCVQVGTLLTTHLLHGTLGTSAIVLLQAGIQLGMLHALRRAWKMRCSYRMVRTLERAIG